ncbi:MAG: DUF4386 domain-containing protein [Candidatus Hodarchaeales archaeon]
MTNEITNRTRTIELSLATYARIAAVAFLIMTIGAIFAYFFVLSNFIVPDDAAKTADNIMDSELLFRLAIAIWVIVLTMDVVVAWALYVLLKPVNKSLALLAAWFRLMMTAMNGAILVFLFIALLLLNGDDYLTAVFTENQLHALALLFLNAFEYGFAIGYVFLGFHLLILGYLVLQSGYFPRIVGALLIVASFGYLLSSFGTFLVPDQAELIDLVVTVPNAIGELSLFLWLLVKGDKMQYPTEMTS